MNLFALPKSVKSAYESALKVNKIDEASCLFSLRRTLEMVCKDKGATKGMLHHKLNHLQQEGILPPLMGDISTVIKDLGNMAAHEEELILGGFMVEKVFNFTNKVLEYVYILPNEMKRVQQELEAVSPKEKAESK
ncbi:DUF4145 domain-containing protein [Halobacillus ihumii]|uniref:DUF4145 domain-containing protein n=1 Tax=Halobacillus ihumii TaxID=2686092 RepID=UPI0013D27174|nr:DUF4145 domain-containing protein [Halobacillus ihumii]